MRLFVQIGSTLPKNPQIPARLDRQRKEMLAAYSPRNSGELHDFHPKGRRRGTHERLGCVLDTVKTVTAVDE